LPAFVTGVGVWLTRQGIGMQLGCRGWGAGMQRPLAVASAAFVAGAFFGCTGSPVAALVAAACALALALWPRARIGALGLALGLLRGAVQERPRSLTVERDEVEATVVSIEPHGAVVRVSGVLAWASLQGEAHRGDRVRAFGSLHEPLPRLNPGGRDRKAELAARGIGADGSLEVTHVLERGPLFWRWLDGLRARFSARAERLCSTPERAALVAALGVGDRSLLTADEEEELSVSGLVHLLASSGLHLAVVVLLVRAVATRLWLRTPWASQVRPAAVAALVAVPLVVGEVLLLGAPWPAVRAGLGAALGLAALVAGRRSDSLTALATAAAGCALLEPAASHELALQLSLAGVFGLIVLTRPLRELLPFARPLRPGLLRRCAEHLLMLACATAAATLCTAPLLAAAFHRISLVSVAANALGLLPGLAAIPIATLALVFDALPLWWLADLLAGATLQAAQLFAAVPHAAIAVAAPGLLACALWYAGVLLLTRTDRPRRRLLRAALPFGALALLGCARAIAPLWSETLRITFLAVGQGDAALVQLPHGHALLIDAGGDLRSFPRPPRDLLPALAELGVSRLDLVVLTHPHPDHAGGMLALLDRVRVDELWMTSSGDGISEAVRKKARERGVPVHEPEPRTIAGVRLEVPTGRWSADRSANDNSIVLRLVHGDAAALLAGDVEALTEAELAQGAAPLRAQLLKAPHHGSRTSSTDAFLRRVQPGEVIYSVGARNGFRFPNRDVVERTEALGARTLSTALGAVLAESDGRVFRVAPWRE
jgi:competence protein ComEC